MSLKRAAFLKGMSEAHVAKLAALGYRVHFDEDQLILADGERSRNFYVLLSGSACVEVRTPVYTVCVQVISPGDAFGWSSLLYRQDTLFQVRAREASSVYDPSTGLFAPTGSMAEPRNSHTATLLIDGTGVAGPFAVLVAGGGNNSPTAELNFDGSFTATGSMEFGRAGHTATALLNPAGVYCVLVVGGGSFNPIATAEIYCYGDWWD